MAPQNKHMQTFLKAGLAVVSLPLSPITTYSHSRLAFLLPSLQPVKSSLPFQEQSLDIINIYRLLLWPNLNCSLASAFCIRYVPNVLSTMPVIVQDDDAHSCSLSSQHHRVEGAGSSWAERTEDNTFDSSAAHWSAMEMLVRSECDVLYFVCVNEDSRGVLLLLHTNCLPSIRRDARQM